MLRDRVEETIREAQRRSGRPVEEARGGARRQRLQREPEEGREALVRSPNRPGRDGNAVRARRIAPRGTRPGRAEAEVPREATRRKDADCGAAVRPTPPPARSRRCPRASTGAARRVDRARRPAAVQSGSKPCSRSASRISGVPILPSGIQIAGGEGIPIVEPPFSVGTASTAQPRPRMPSVQ